MGSKEPPPRAAWRECLSAREAALGVSLSGSALLSSSLSDVVSDPAGVSVGGLSLGTHARPSRCSWWLS